jgi:hypothetical protein
MTAIAHPAPTRHDVGIGALWFGLVATPLAWSIQELVSYAVVTHACYPYWQPRYLPAISGTWTLTLVVSVLTTLLGIAGLLTAYRSWRRISSQAGYEAHRHLDVGEDRARFMAMSGVIVSSIILFNIAMNAITLFLVQAC